jgi:hypothetical protein
LLLAVAHQIHRWYFDVVSTSSQNESIDIVFYYTGAEGFPGGDASNPLSVEVSGTFANGTIFDYSVPATLGATITEDDDGLKAEWKGAETKAVFEGTSLLQSDVYYKIDISSKEIGVSGTVKFKSVSLSISDISTKDCLLLQSLTTE